MYLNLLSIMDGTKALRCIEISQVCILGVVIVFFGLICIVLLCSIMSAIFKAFNKKENATPQTQSAPVVTAAQAEPIANKQEFIAAVSAAIAKDMGTDISAIRITSIKKI